MKNKIRIGAILLITAGMLTQYTNCAEKLPDNLNAPSVGTNAAQNSLTLSVNPQTILPTQTAQISVSGGVAPYIFTVTSGGIAVSSSGLVTPSAVGAATVEVTDQNGNHSSVSVSVVTSLTGTGASCTTSFGQTVPHGAQVTVYAAATVKCPATCMAQTQTCTNGVLSGATGGVSGTCSVSACVYKPSNAGQCTIASLPGGMILDPPATCPAADFGKYFCGKSLNPNGLIGEYQCSSP